MGLESSWVPLTSTWLLWAAASAAYHYTWTQPSLESTSYPLDLPFRVPATSKGEATDRFGGGPQAGGPGFGAPT